MTYPAWVNNLREEVARVLVEPRRDYALLAGIIQAYAPAVERYIEANFIRGPDAPRHRAVLQEYLFAVAKLADLSLVDCVRHPHWLESARACKRIQNLLT